MSDSGYAIAAPLARGDVRRCHRWQWPAARQLPSWRSSGEVSLLCL